VREVRTRERASAEVVDRATVRDASARRPVVELHGDCDAGSVATIEPLLRRRFGPFFFRRHLVVDISDVRTVDESFIDLVIGLARRLHGERRELVLVRPSGGVGRSLARVGLPNLVPVYESVDEAYDALEGSGGPLIPPRFDAAGRPGL
jgi:anti-anti-sigma factor